MKRATPVGYRKLFVQFEAGKTWIYSAYAFIDCMGPKNMCVEGMETRSNPDRPPVN